MDGGRQNRSRSGPPGLPPGPPNPPGDPDQDSPGGPDDNGWNWLTAGAVGLGAIALGALALKAMSSEDSESKKSKKDEYETIEVPKNTKVLFERKNPVNNKKAIHRFKRDGTNQF